MTGVQTCALPISTRARTGSTFALSTTGIAGPAGGTQATPVGTVFIGVAGPQGARVQRFRFLGNRERVRVLAAQTALDLLRRVVAALRIE